MNASIYMRRCEVITQYGLTNRILSSWQSRRLIPFVKVGRRLTLFKAADIEDFLVRHTVQSKSDLAGRKAVAK